MSARARCQAELALAEHYQAHMTRRALLLLESGDPRGEVVARQAQGCLTRVLILTAALKAHVRGVA